MIRIQQEKIDAPINIEKETEQIQKELTKPDIAVILDSLIKTICVYQKECEDYYKKIEAQLTKIDTFETQLGNLFRTHLPQIKDALARIEEKPRERRQRKSYDIRDPDSPATEKQLSLLRRLHTQYNSNVTKGEASELIDKKINEQNQRGR